MSLEARPDCVDSIARRFDAAKSTLKPLDRDRERRGELASPAVKTLRVPDSRWPRVEDCIPNLRHLYERLASALR